MGKYAKYAASAIFLIFAATLSPWKYNFPLNDDWAYALAARALAATGRLTLSDWGASTQLPHIITGAFFTKIFGFSFSVLRAANLLVAAAALFVFARLMDEFEIGPFEKTAAALTLAFSPLYLVLANSFMTDIHYLFWMLSAVYFYVRRLKDPGDGRALFFAGACAAAAYLTRQLAVALPLAFTIMLFLEGRAGQQPVEKVKGKNKAQPSPRRSFPGWRTLAAVWALPLAAMGGYQFWFTRIHGPTWVSGSYVVGATLAHITKPGLFIGDSVYRVFSAILESGLLLLPLAAGFLFSARGFSSKNGLQRKVTSAGPWLALAALAVFAFLYGPLPYLENTISRSGLGALTLGGAGLKPSGLFASQVFWLLATAASLVSAVLLLCASSLALRAGGPELRFIFAAALLQLGVSLAGAKFFDRYLLTLLPWFAFAAAFAAKGVRFSKPAAGLTLVFCAALAWAGMKDYLAWNGAKWELALKPRAETAPGEIINGFDYEAWFNYEKNMAYLKSMKPLNMIGEWEWQKGTNYKAIISFTPDPRFKVLDKIEYSTPLSSRKGVLYLMSVKQ
ncbi:MAG: glycosyltransferase family 39 protein [Elusimicrobiales bacterium]|nr:glycosyltransferase family 39 protein [Elusimicrobiales bacterium]